MNYEHTGMQTGSQTGLYVHTIYKLVFMQVCIYIQVYKYAFIQVCMYKEIYVRNMRDGRLRFAGCGPTVHVRKEKSAKATLEFLRGNGKRPNWRSYSHSLLREFYGMSISINYNGQHTV